MDTLSALLDCCARNPKVTGGFPSQRPVTRGFHICFDLRLNNRDVGDLRRHHGHYDVTAIYYAASVKGTVVYMIQYMFDVISGCLT